MGKRRHLVTDLISTLSLAAILAAGCTKSKPVVQPPPPPPAVAKPAVDPMLVTLEGALANKYVRAASPGEVIARLRIDTKPLDRDERPPVNLALAIDTSGSMEGDAIAYARSAAQELLQQLAVGDRLAVVAFHSTAEVLVPSTRLTADNKATISEAIGTMKAIGTTDMAGGLALALEQMAPHRSEQVMSRLVLLSDGVPNDEQPIATLTQRAQQSGIAVTSLGLGVEYNETLLAQIAQRTGGSFHYVEEPAQVAGVFRDQVLRLQRMVARGMTLHLSPGPGVTVTEVIGHPLHRSNPRSTFVQLGDLAEGEPRDVLVRLAVGSRRDGASVELLDSVLSFADAVDNAGRFQRRVFLGARAISDTAAWEAGRVQAIEEAVESARAAAATINAVANARAGNLSEAQRILSVAGNEARGAAKRYNNAELARQAEEMERLQSALPSLATPPQPVPGPQHGRPVPVPQVAEDAPATVRAVHGNAMDTLRSH